MQRLYSLAWAPDGGRIAYTESGPDRGPKDAHVVVNVATKEAKPLKLPPGHHIKDWTRDGNHLLTVSWAERTSGLYLVSVASGEATQLTDDSQQHLSTCISPDGRRVLMERFEPPKNLQQGRGSWMAVFDLALKKATPISGVEPKANVTGFCWAPDGKRVAYLWVRHVDRVIPVGQFDTIETERKLTVCDPDGKNAKTILTEKGGLGPLLRAREIDWR